MRSSAAHMIGAALPPEYLAGIHPLGPDDISVEPAPRLLRLVWGSQTKAMTLGQRVFVDPGVLSDGGPRLARLLMHELVHARQWAQEGTIGFPRRYLLQYVVARLTGASHRNAYHSIDHEVEARRLSGL